MHWYKKIAISPLTIFAALVIITASVFLVAKSINDESVNSDISDIINNFNIAEQNISTNNLPWLQNNLRKIISCEGYPVDTCKAARFELRNYSLIFTAMDNLIANSESGKSLQAKEVAEYVFKTLGIDRDYIINKYLDIDWELLSKPDPSKHIYSTIKKITALNKYGFIDNKKNLSITDLYEMELCRLANYSHLDSSLEAIKSIHKKYRYRTGLLVCGKKGICAQGLYQSSVSNVARSKGYPYNRSKNELENANKVMKYLSTINLLQSGIYDWCINDTYLSRIPNDNTLSPADGYPYSLDPRRNK